MMARFTGMGQAYMGGNENVATKTGGTLTNVGRCMVSPPPTLTVGASVG
jgi:hypothetical protein